MLGAEVDKLLATVGLEIQWLEVFYLGKNSDHSIHCDGHELDDKAKINYVIGGTNSAMTWYEPVDEIKIQKKISPANTVYLSIDPKDVLEVDSTEIKGLYLVNVGRFHNVWNKNEDRYCLSASVVDIETGHRPLFKELQARLKDYIND
jgi:thioredoxin reductase